MLHFEEVPPAYRVALAAGFSWRYCVRLGATLGRRPRLARSSARRTSSAKEPCPLSTFAAQRFALLRPHPFENRGKARGHPSRTPAWLAAPAPRFGALADLRS